jgi:hypothetical protein
MRESPSGKASAFQADIRGFESHLPLQQVLQCHVSGVRSRDAEALEHLICL